ncbi:MAG: hypothetical protein NTX65_10305 [Ignavibacteriales bacterium]|nr:hypothetical protein [Ignavibacteriales bacterium]
MKKFAVIILLGILGLIFIAAVPASTNVFKNKKGNSEKNLSSDNKEIKKEFQVKAGGKLNFDLKSGASITAEGWDKELVSVEVQLSGRDADNVEFEFSQSGNDVKVESDYKEKSKHNSTNIKVLVMMPRKYNIEFTTTGGSINLKKAEGEFEGTTMGGAISMSDLKGTAKMKTMGGSINVERCDLDGKVETMGGSIDVDDLIGTLDLSTMGGSIKQNNVRGRNNSSGKEITISTMGGSIEVDQAMNGAKVKTMGGPITINKAAKFIDAETMGGNIEVKEINGWIKAKTMGGDVNVKMVGNPNEGKRDVSLQSMGGDITLTVPEGLSMDIEIEIAYAKDKKVKSDDEFNKLKIVSDFPVKEERTKEWDNSKGSPRKYVYGTGTINGGKNKIKIKTINGNVYLKKS